RRFLLFLCACNAGVIVPIASHARGAEPTIYGGIEIGSKGIKAIAIPIDSSGIPNLAGLRKLPKTVVTNVTLAARKDGNFVPEALEEAGAAVHDYYKYLTGELRISPDRIWIVASSGLIA